MTQRENILESIQVAGKKAFEGSRWKEAIMFYLNGMWADDAAVTQRPELSLNNTVLRWDGERYIGYYFLAPDTGNPPTVGARNQLLILEPDRASVENGLVRFVKNSQIRQLHVLFGAGYLVLTKGRKRSELFVCVGRDLPSHEDVLPGAGFEVEVGIGGTDELLSDGTPQVALIGRSNVGKSSIINSLTGEEALARTSKTPGLTQEINMYSINNKFYLLDLPGYGFAKIPARIREKIQKLNWWYLFDSDHTQHKAVLVLDANVGPSKNDIEILRLLRDHQKDIVIVANKIDKIKPADYDAQLQAIIDLAHGLPVIPYSSVKKIGIQELRNLLF